MLFEFRLVVPFEVSGRGPSDNVRDLDWGSSYLGCSYLIKIH